ncbi:facilitated trehalose transporter Tret1 [Drosophila grimshawi]|uniref:GH11263 n=1 Tax=Drosophila grimshawi TaxID=7222 RepID=B4JDX1_DROGR|nr:facilitated trehalose transporter Tret1 [Drosophila grimshawi]EDW03491.1 GH11263 [Drosophila grimshawi]
MLLNIFKSGIFQKDFRRQLLVTLSVILITFCHGIAIGWLAPMLQKLQSESETPLDFVIDVNEASWLGSLVSLGGLSGNFFFAFIMNRFGRKVAIYGMAVPNMCIWILFYFAESIEWLYVARVCTGLTGGGIFIVLPMFIGEIADNSIRGRLCSLCSLAMNLGILSGFIISSYVPYHIIPRVVILLPLCYLLLATRYPEVPQQLMRRGRIEDAERSLKYYWNCDGPAPSKEAERACQKQFNEMRESLLQQGKESSNDGLTVADFCNKRALKAIMTGIVLMIANMFTGTFAFINYMSTIFERVHTQLEPNTNTIIIGAVQVVGTLASIYLVDRYGRKILLVISCVGSVVGTAAFGIYAFYAEETDADLSAFSAWLPVTIMAFIIFVATVGVISVTFVVLVEIIPPKIRSVASSACLGCLSVFGFISVKSLPIMMEYLGLAATMWGCAAVSAICAFYVVVFVQETKGKSMYN